MHISSLQLPPGAGIDVCVNIVLAGRMGLGS
jgi:hypothetical protein